MRGGCVLRVMMERIAQQRYEARIDDRQQRDPAMEMDSHEKVVSRVDGDSLLGVYSASARRTGR
jgi:hypothetical protein